jgi:hypothetical protein
MNMTIRPYFLAAVKINYIWGLSAILVVGWAESDARSSGYVADASILNLSWLRTPFPRRAYFESAQIFGNQSEV